LFRSDLRLEPISGCHDVLMYCFLMHAGVDRQHILEKLRNRGKRQVSSPFGQQKFQLSGRYGLSGDHSGDSKSLRMIARIHSDAIWGLRNDTSP